MRSGDRWLAAAFAAVRLPPMRVALVVWLGTAVGGAMGVYSIWLGIAGGAAAAMRRVPWLLTAVFAAGLVSGALGEIRLEAAAEIEPGPVELVAAVSTDALVRDGASEVVVTARTPGRGHNVGAQLLVVTAGTSQVELGATVSVSGKLRSSTGWFGRHRYDGTVIDAMVTQIDEPGRALQVANLVRRHVLGNVGRGSQPRALLAGFLVGDTSQLDAAHVDDLRRTGLSHYVAVSGSNVALVLVAWWLVAGSIGVPGRLRVVLAVAVVAVFALVTRWEPSVVRAALMAALVLLARLAGYPLTTWQALGGAVTLALLVSPELGSDPGFQLSVAATFGVMLASSRARPARGGVFVGQVTSLLVITTSAQVAVLPIVLLRFGSAPLLSPIANLAAAPLVTAATVVGGVGAVTGIEPLVAAAMVPARMVLTIAALGSGWPQLVPHVVASLGVVAWLWRLPSARWSVVAVALGASAVATMGAPVLDEPSVVFLDVGQGDAILIRDGEGRVALVDGGPDPEILQAALDRHGVDRLDYVLVTHGDTDHAGGLVGLVGSRRVGTVGYPMLQPQSELLHAVLSDASDADVAQVALGFGDRLRLGDIRIDVLSPARRYAAENDGSLVLWVGLGHSSVLLTGDVGAIAQAELPSGLRPMALQVPHHGSATTDVSWLQRTVGGVAVISVGPNRHGHPADPVLEALELAGVEVHTTWRDGDVIIPLGPKG